MPSSTTREEREARIRYLRDRHRLVITTAVIGIIVAALIAVPLALGWIGAPKKDDSGSQANNYGERTACLASDKDTAVAANHITLRVLNGTKHAGFATAVGQEFTNRGFVVQGTGNWNSKTVSKKSIIYFGRNTVAEAYTLRAEFPNNVILRMDDRKDYLLDIVIGDDFRNLETTQKVTEKTKKRLTSTEGCVAPDKLTKVPQAQEHTEVWPGDNQAS